jgi:two-component system, sensor histidine kinase PdtaS
MKRLFKHHIRYCSVCIWACIMLFSVNMAAMSQVDSLKKVLVREKNNTGKIQILLGLAEKLNSTDASGAFFFASEALRLSDSLDWPQGKMSAELAIANCYSTVMITDEAVKHYKKCIEEARKINNRDVELNCLRIIGQLYFDANDFPTAIYYLEYAFSIAQKYHSVDDEIVDLSVLSGIAYQSNRYHDAVIYLRSALALLNSLDPIKRARYKAATLNNMAGAQLGLGNTDSALLYIRTACNVLPKNDIPDSLHVLSTFCDIFRVLKKYDSVCIYAERVMAVSLPNELTIKKDYAKYLSQVYEKQNQPSTALKWLKIYDSVSLLLKHDKQIADEAKQVMRIDFAKKIEKYELQQKTFETDRHNQAVALASTVCALFLSIIFCVFIYISLRQKHKKNKMISDQASELKKQNEQIDKSLKEKEILLKEVHHRVKNNLQLISSLLALQADETSDEHAKASLNESQSRVLSMSVIHRRLYQNENLDTLDISTFTDEVFLQIKNIFSNTDALLENQLPHQYYEVDQALALGLILNELITNSFKHARPENDRLVIRVQLKKEGREFHLEYSDNGQGLPAAFSMESSNSLGMRLINWLAEQLNGRVIQADGENIFEIYFIDDESI